MSKDASKTVLLVEDDARTADMERLMLVRAGITTVIAPSVSLALELLAGQDFDAVVLDYQLPDGEAWVVLEAAKSKKPRIPVVLVTRQGDEITAAEAIHRGVTDYLRKSGPLLQQLPAVLEEVIRVAHAQEHERQAGEMFRLMVDSVKDYAIVLLDADGYVSSWNAGAEQLKGYRSEEIIGQHFAKFYPKEDVLDGKPRRELVKAVADGGLEDEGWRVRKNGTRFIANVVISPVRDLSGRLRGFVKVTRDVSERHRIDALLAHSRERFVVAAETAILGVWELDVASHSFKLDDQLLQLYGHSGVAEDPHALWLDSLHPDDRARCEAEVAAAIAAASGFDSQCRIVLPDGRIRVMKVAARVTRGDDGRLARIYGVNFDITEVLENRSELAAAARETEGLLGTLHLHGLVSMSNRDGLITDANTAFCKISGYTREEMLGQNYSIVNSGTHAREFWQGLWQTVESGKPWRGEICNRAKSGSLYWVDSIIAPILGADRKLVKYVSVSFDITPHKESQRRLRESEMFLQRVEKVSGVGGFMIDLASRTQHWTRQSYRIHDLDETCEHTLEMDAFLSPEVYAQVQESTRPDGAATGYDIEAPIVTAAGRSIWIRTVGEVERIQGVAVRVVGAIQDITERRIMESQLRDATTAAEKANKAKSEFLANMSHEIRTPLNAVIGLGYLLEQTPLNEDQRQFLSKIQFSGRALLSVVNNVLDLSKIEAGEVALEYQTFDLRQLVRDLIQMLAPQAEAKGIGLIVQSSSGLPCRLIGDFVRLRQILINLLNNSIKFTEHGEVELSVSCAADASDRIRLRCVVRDSGIGMDAVALARLFTPFTQADASTTRRFGGTGLGLSIARRLVELMGGEIGVTSTVAVGSTFWIEMPMQIAGDSGDSPGADAERSVQIMIADSMGKGLHGLVDMVRALGWSPQTLATGEQILAGLRDSKPDTWPGMLILEPQLRDMGAHRLLGRIEQECKQGRRPPVLVVADVTERYIEIQNLMEVGDTLLLRPVTSSMLFNAINTAIWRGGDARDLSVEYTTNLHAKWLVGVHVLVVDDSDINLEVAKGILERQGAIVKACSDAGSALEHVRAPHRQLDLILMDVQMPILDGLEATRRIREEHELRALPIVALTAGALVGERHRALESGMNDFISKPFDPQALIRMVRRLVEQARGELIPIVFLDSEPKSVSGPLSMSSIDFGSVRRIFDDDLTLFKSLLTRFVRDCADLASPSALSLDNHSTRRELEARAHKLKGSAGMIGANRVMRLASAAETALRDGRPAGVVAQMLKQLAAALSVLRQEAQSVLAIPEEGSADSTSDVATCTDYGSADLDELYTLLESQNLAAVDQLGRLTPRLRGMLDDARFNRLTGAVDSLDFQAGAAVLREARLAGVT